MINTFGVIDMERYIVPWWKPFGLIKLNSTNPSKRTDKYYSIGEAVKAFGVKLSNSKQNGKG